MFAPPPPPSWPWVHRLRIAANLAWLSWAVVGLVRIFRAPAGVVALAFVVGLGFVVLLVVRRGPSRLDAHVAWALRCGRPVRGVPPALVDAEAARVLGEGRWARFALPGAFLVVVVMWCITVVRGPDAERVVTAAAMSLVVLAGGWSATTAVREARRWTAARPVDVPEAAADPT